MRWFLGLSYFILCMFWGSSCSSERYYDLSKHGILPGKGVDNAVAMANALDEIRNECNRDRRMIVTSSYGLTVQGPGKIILMEGSIGKRMC